jgi:hypothetical protein
MTQVVANLDADRKLNEERFRTLNRRHVTIAEESRAVREEASRDRRTFADALTLLAGSLGRIEGLLHDSLKRLLKLEV